MKLRTLFVLFSAFLISQPLQAAEPQQATVLRDTELRADPFSDAVVVTRVRAESSLRVLQRRGGWYQVRDKQKRTGWLRMSTIRFGDGNSAASDNGGNGLEKTMRFLSTGRSGASGTTVATGIRGLDSADMSNATPDHAAVKQLDSFKVSAKDARAFAQTAELDSQELDYMEGDE